MYLAIHCCKHNCSGILFWEQLRQAGVGHGDVATTAVVHSCHKVGFDGVETAELAARG